MILAYKRVGETPLELIQRLNINPPATYAGRLDPMAEGLVIILNGNETREKEKYLQLDKTYEINVLFGITTDTYDTLGIISNNNLPTYITSQKIKRVLSNFNGRITQTYPLYSAKTVDGKPLWQWAKESRTQEITLPNNPINIHKTSLKRFYNSSLKDEVSKIIPIIETVNGDFRQAKIIKQWKNLKDSNIQIADLTIDCSSGTYMRSLANDLGNLLGTGAIALSIRRTRIGNFSLDQVK